MTIGLWTPGATAPEFRMFDLVRRDPFSLVSMWPLKSFFTGGWPAVDQYSPEQISDLVFNFMQLVETLPDLAFLVPDQDKDRIARFYGRASWQDIYSTPGLVSALVALYCNVSLQSALPDDHQGTSQAIAVDWPNKGDNFEQVIYAWDIKVRGWGGKTGSIPHIQTTKVSQIQKWDTVNGAWKVYNQWGENLLFAYDPAQHTWSAGFNVQEWLDEHNQEIFTAWNIIFTAVSTIATLGFSASFTAAATTLGQIAALQASSRGLAVACASGSIDQIAGALVNVSNAIVGLPGGKQIVDSLKNAGAAAISDALSQGRNSLAVILPAMSDAQGDLSSAINKTLANASQLKSTVEQEIADVRASLIPDGLKPFFDKAVSQGTGAATRMFLPNMPVPWYARSAWDIGAAYGAIAGNGSWILGGVKATKLVIHPDQVGTLATVTALPAQKLAASNLLAYVRDLEKVYGLSSLETVTRRAELKAKGYTDQQLKEMGY
jgi:hypothetical protein